MYHFKTAFFGAISSELVVYCFRMIFFGAIGSPFMLYAALYYHLQHSNSKLSYDIQTNLYVDNIMSGCETESAVIQYYNQVRAIM